MPFVLTTSNVTCVGPLKKTLIDFWRLIWQERPQIIVMVTNLKEGSKTKCEKYWPSETSAIASYGPFNVTLAEEQIFPDFIIRSLSVQVRGRREREREREKR